MTEAMLDGYVRKIGTGVCVTFTATEEFLMLCQDESKSYLAELGNPSLPYEGPVPAIWRDIARLTSGN